MIVTMLVLLYSNTTTHFCHSSPDMLSFLLRLLFLQKFCVAAALLFFVKEKSISISRDCNTPDLEGLPDLLPDHQATKICMVVNYNLMCTKEAARERHAHWQLAQLLKHLFTDFKHQLSPVVAMLHKLHFCCLSFQIGIQIPKATYELRGAILKACVNVY